MNQKNEWVLSPHSTSLCSFFPHFVPEMVPFFARLYSELFQLIFTCTKQSIAAASELFRRLQQSILWATAWPRTAQNSPVSRRQPRSSAAFIRSCFLCCARKLQGPSGSAQPTDRQRPPSPAFALTDRREQTDGKITAFLFLFCDFRAKQTTVCFPPNRKAKERTLSVSATCKLLVARSSL